MKTKHIPIPAGVDLLIVDFPGGSVSVARTSTGDHWAHITREHELNSEPEDVGEIRAARLDKLDAGMLESQALVPEVLAKGLYHVALRIGLKDGKGAGNG